MNRIPQAFTRIELAATVAALALLGLAALPLLATTRDHSGSVGCFNNLRRLGIAALEYADDHDGFFPPRRFSIPAGYWPETLRRYYTDTGILTCPNDGPNPRSFFAEPGTAVGAPRSYILNGFSDYYWKIGDMVRTQAIPVVAIPEPAQTILFGEKTPDSSHFWMDIEMGDDLSVLENGRHHRSGENSASGASNHAFVDGSVRLLKWGAAFEPVLLWAVEPEFRAWEPLE